MSLNDSVDLVEQMTLAEADDATCEFRDSVYSHLTNLGTHNGWISACHSAFERADEPWLIRYTEELNVTQLPWFLKRLHREETNAEQESRPLTTRVRIAQSIADTALSALLLKRLSQGASNRQIEPLLRSIYRAVVRWQPLTSSAKISLIPDLDTANEMRNSFLRSVAEVPNYRAVLSFLQDRHADWEMAPICELISHFLGERNDQWERMIAVNVPLVRWDKTGLVARLELEKRRSGTNVFYRDPLTMSFFQYDAAFKSALESAWSYANRVFSDNRSDVRWRLKCPGQELLNPVIGGSIGAAFAIALKSLLGKPVSSIIDWAITGAITDHGEIGTVNGRDGILHDDYREKLSAVSERRLKLIVPGDDWQHVRDEFAASNIQILKGATTIEEANEIIIDHENGERAKQKIATLKRFAIAALIFGLMALGSLTVYAFNKRSQADAARKEALEQRQRAEIARQEADKLRALAEQARGEAVVQKDKAQENEQKAKQSEGTALVQRRIADFARVEAQQQRSVAESQREEAKHQERIAAAHRQLAFARQLELQASKALADNNPAGAQVLFAKGLTFDDSRESREGLLEATTNSAGIRKTLWTATTGNQVVAPITFSPDLKYFVWGDDDGSFHVLDASNGRELKKKLAHEGAITSIVFTPDSSGIITAGVDGTLKLWGVDANALIRDFNISESVTESSTSARPNVLLELHTVEERSVLSSTVSADGKYLAAGDSEGDVWLWNLKTGQRLNIFEADGPIMAVAFGPDNELAAGSLDRTVRVWKVSDNKAQAELRLTLELANPILSLSFNPTGQELAIAAGSELRIWNLNSHSWLVLPGHQRAVNSIAFSPDSRHLASGSEDGTVRLWSAKTGKLITTIGQDLGLVWRITFGPSGQIASSSLNQPIRCWASEAARTLFHRLEGHVGTITRLSFSPNGNLTSVDEHGNTLLWEVSRGNNFLKIRYADDGFQNLNTAIAVSPDSSLLFLGGTEKDIRLWLMPTARRYITLKGHEGVVNDVAFSPNGRSIASASDDDTVRIWDVETGKERHVLRSHDDDVTRVAFSPDSKSLASSSADATIKLWDVATGGLTKTLESHSGPIVSLAYSPDGKYLVSSGLDSHIYLWDAKQGRGIIGFNSIEIGVSATFSADGRYILWAAPASRQIRIVETETGRELPSIRTPYDEVVTIAISGDGNWLAGGGRRSHLYLWHLNEIFRLNDTKAAELFAGVISQTGLELSSPAIQTLPQTELDKLVAGEEDISFSLVAREESEEKTAFKTPRRRYSSDVLGHRCPHPLQKPTLNPFPLTFASPAGYCRNYPPIDVRLATENSDYSQNEEDWKNGITAVVGDEIHVLLSIHNGAANIGLPAEVTLARNIKVTTRVDTEARSVHIVGVSFLGENTNAVSAEVPIHTEPNSRLQIVPNSGEIRDVTGTKILKNRIQIGNNTISIGDLGPGFETDLFIRFKVKVIKSNAKRSLENATYIR